MNFYEVETWRPRLSCPAEEYEKAIENWFTYVTEKKGLFPGLISAKYFNKCDREANPDGYYMMILEYESPEACKALHARIRDSLEKNDGVYAEYAAKDPHSCFDIDHMNMRYLRIYFSASIAVLGYGINDGILRGLGDSRASLLFLSLSCLINVGLDILLVAGMQLGVVGVAIATVLAELAACILSTGYIFRNYIGKVQSSRARWHTVKNICAIGLPLGLKQMLFAPGVIMVQMVINRCEPSFIAGFNAASKIDMFAALPIQSFSVAMMTFIGQNIGARKEDRIYIGIKEALKLSLMVDVVLVVLIMTFAPQLLRLFNSDPSVIAGGLAYLYRIMPFYVIYTVTSLIQSVLNGLGNVLVSTLIMSGAQWLGRVPAAWLLYKLCSPENVYFCYGIGWIIELSCLVAYIVIGLYGKRLKSKLGEAKR